MTVPIKADSESAEDDAHSVMEGDRELLREEEESENLLASASTHARGYNRDEADGRELRQHERAKRRRGKREAGLLTSKMEQGVMDDASSTSSRSSMEREFIGAGHITSKHAVILRSIFLPVTVAALFFLLLFGSYKMSDTSLRKVPSKPILSNGTSKFAPTTILVSLDGFRADFLKRGLTPTLNSFIAEGISPDYMLPSFPSVTFPNHYTLVTGLYPESHGVVSNTFWDPDLQAQFHYTDPTRSMQAKWWTGGEPLWVTAERQNVRTAVHMWPGSEAHVQLEPSYLDKFNATEVLSRKVDRILEFIDLPGEYDLEAVGNTRPQFIAFYVPNVDAQGHLYGPNSTEIRATINDVDSMLHDLISALQQRNLTDIVNVVVVSDHGMATTSAERLIQLEDLIDVNLVEHIDGWPLYGLRPKDPMDIRGLYDRLSVESAKNPNFDVYLKDGNMPERYHFTKNDRIAPLWIVPKTGWAVVRKEMFDIEKDKGKIYHPRGLHGYDHEHPLMRAIFVARGLAFPSQPNSRMQVFQNIEVYNIICDSLGITPKPNNGTLRLPFKSIGLHSDEPTSDTENTPADPPVLTSTPASFAPTPTSRPIGVDTPTLPPTTTPATRENSTTSEKQDGKGEKEEVSTWWKAFINNINTIKAWLDDVFDSKKGQDTGLKDE